MNECNVCFETTPLHTIHPCTHQMCITCFNNMKQTITHPLCCPFCRTTMVAFECGEQYMCLSKSPTLDEILRFLGPSWDYYCEEHGDVQFRYLNGKRTPPPPPNLVAQFKKSFTPLHADLYIVGGIGLVLAVHGEIHNGRVIARHY